MATTATMMTANEAAAALDGSEYGKEGSRELFAAMREAGLVALFGYSDDLVEMRGAVDDEAGAWNGARLLFTPDGLLANECEDEDCPYFARLKKRAAPVDVQRSTSGFPWFIRADFPNMTFEVREGGEPFCRGIVFALSDVPTR